MKKTALQISWFLSFSHRLLLWDCDDRTYSYYIEVSNDQKSWTKVVDKTQEACKYVHTHTRHAPALLLPTVLLVISAGCMCRSWQVVEFDPLPITFIKLVGIQNTANEVRQGRMPVGVGKVLGLEELCPLPITLFPNSPAMPLLFSYSSYYAKIVLNSGPMSSQ